MAVTRGTVVLVSSIPWHSPWQRHHALAVALSDRGYRVVFVEPLPKRWPAWTERGRVFGRLTGDRKRAGIGSPQTETEGIELVSPRLLPDVGRLSQAINRRFLIPPLARRLRKTLTRPLIVLNYLPIRAALALQERLLADLVVYDCCGDWSTDLWSRDETIVERDMIRTADLVFADSPYLLTKMRALHPRVEHVLPAVDYGLYSRAQHADRCANREIRCVYFGTVGSWLDLPLLREVGRRFRLRIIGPVMVDPRELAGAEIVGAVPRERLPGLIRDCHVVLLPYQDTPHNQGVIPAKTYECLATGKPVVSIGLSSLESLSPLIRTCLDHDEFLLRIEQVADEPPSQAEARIAVARENSWERRAEQVDRLFGKALRCDLSLTQPPGSALNPPPPGASA